MRVCIVSRELAPHTGWGVGTYAANVVRALADAGHDTHILTAPAPGLAGRPDQARAGAGVRVHTIDRSGPPATLRHVPCRATQGPLAIFQTLRALHERHRFQYIEFADVYGEGYFAAQARRAGSLFDDTILAVRFHSPIFVLRQVNGQDTLDLNTACVERMERDALEGMDLVISPSLAMIEKAGALHAGARWPDRAHVLPYPFDPGLLSRADASPPLPARPGGPATGSDPLVLFFGRLEHRKGAHLLIDAAQRLLAEGLRLRVRIVGENTSTAPGGGAVLSWLQARIDPRWTDRFEFQPNRPRHQLASMIREASVCCAPSLWENAPFALLEAMALGACVVASDAGGIPEIVRDGSDGLLFRSGDAGALAGALRRAITDATLRARISAAAPVRVAELCDPRRTASRLESTIEQARPRVPRSRSAQAAGPRPADADSVSVLIPFFNLARYLPAALESVRTQTRPPGEIIIIDDGSTEPDAVTLIERIEGLAGSSGGPPLRVIRQPNRGLSAARNAGLRLTGSRWVLPLDADDLLAPTFIEAALDAAARSPGAVLVTSWMACFQESPDTPTLLFVPVGFDRDLLAVANVASSCTALLDRQAVLGAGGYDEALPAYEDWDLYCTLAASAVGDAVIIPEPLILNRIRPDSMLRAMDQAARDALHTRIRAKHPALAAEPDRVARMLAPPPVPATGRAPAQPQAAPRPALLTRVARRVLGVRPRA